MDLGDYRAKIDKIDDELLRLFMERMDTCRQIAQYKKENGLPVLDAEREGKKLSLIGEKAGEMRSFAQTLFRLLLDLSRAHQETFM